MTSTDTSRKIKAAFEQLMLDRAELTDGALTIANICAEAGVSRASYYRSPQAAEIKQILDAPATRRPEIDQLREEVKRLKHTELKLRSEHAAETRRLRDTLTTYANQIQVLALHVTHLENDNRLLREHLAGTGDNVTALDTRR
jgi:hypothetical protein